MGGGASEDVRAHERRGGQHFLVRIRGLCDELLALPRFFDGWSGSWYDFLYVGTDPKGIESGTPNFAVVMDTGTAADPLLGEVEIPATLELDNDFASAARYVALSQGRVWGACLDYNSGSGKWDRPTAIEVSSEGKPWAFPTTVDDTSPITDGSELEGYAQTGSEVRGLLARGENILVFLDNEFFTVRGDTPLGSGYQFTRADSIGCVSARTIADCRSVVIWHSGAHFYGYGGGLAKPISQYRLDSSGIDWSKPHNAVCWREKYLLFCWYQNAPSIITFDLLTEGWRVRASDAYDLAGICTSGDNDKVYGMTRQTGEVADLFGGETDYGAEGGTQREIQTQYWQVGSPGEDVLVEAVEMEAELDPVAESDAGATLTVAVRGQGRVSRTVTRSVTINTDKTFYEVGLGGMKADAVKVEITYVGTRPPVIHYLGLRTGAGVAV